MDVTVLHRPYVVSCGQEVLVGAAGCEPIAEQVAGLPERRERHIELLVRVLCVDGNPQAGFALRNARWTDRLDEHPLFKQEFRKPHGLAAFAQDHRYNVRCAGSEVEAELQEAAPHVVGLLEGVSASPWFAPGDIDRGERCSENRRGKRRSVNQ